MPPATDQHAVSPAGLSPEEVRVRVERGQTNGGAQPTSRSVAEILRANVLTRFNAILGALLVAILAAGHPQDGLFGIVLVANALIGIVQELRAKRTLDRLAVLSAPRARVRRGGAEVEIAVEEVVLDDLVLLAAGDQVVADGVIEEAAGLELDESLLEAPEVFADEDDGVGDEFDPDEDPLLERAIEIVVQTQTASVSLIQRRLRVGYTRAGRLIDMLERRGIISGYEGSKPRRVLVGEGDLDRVLSP